MRPGPTILVVEDEALIAMALIEELEASGFTVLHAARGEDAVALLQRSWHVDILVTDLDLGGGLNGRTVAQRARELHPNIHVIYASGQPEILGETAIVPDARFVWKPYQPVEILCEVASLVESR